MRLRSTEVLKLLLKDVEYSRDSEAFDRVGGVGIPPDIRVKVENENLTPEGVEKVVSLLLLTQGAAADAVVRPLKQMNESSDRDAVEKERLH